MPINIREIFITAGEVLIFIGGVFYFIQGLIYLNTVFRFKNNTPFKKWNMNEYIKDQEKYNHMINNKNIVLFIINISIGLVFMITRHYYVCGLIIVPLLFHTMLIKTAKKYLA
jgi:hypothetical protein